MKKLLVMSLLFFWSCDGVFSPCDVEILGECYSIENASVINLASKGLTKIPEEIFQLKNLTSLSLSYNNLKEIPVEITLLTKLQYLYLNDNQINKMEYSLNELKELTFLNISNNQINEVINDSICPLINNTYININGNEIQPPLPVCVDNNLEFSVNLWNKEYSIESTTYLSKSINGSTIPKEIGFLKNLETLIIREGIGTIPSEIGHLTNLKTLNLGIQGIEGEKNEFIGEIPDEIGNLINLESLDLSDNQLSGSIPESFENLIKLEYLNLSDNQLSGLIPVFLCEIEPYIHFINNQTSVGWRNINLTSNKFCSPFPTCFDTLDIEVLLGFSGNLDWITSIQSYIGQQNTGDCD